MVDPKRSPEEQEEDDATEQRERGVPEDLEVGADDATEVMGGRSTPGVIPLEG
jgi:hypothetical protein